MKGIIGQLIIIQWFKSRSSASWRHVDYFDYVSCVWRPQL